MVGPNVVGGVPGGHGGVLVNTNSRADDEATFSADKYLQRADNVERINMCRGCSFAMAELADKMRRERQRMIWGNFCGIGEIFVELEKHHFCEKFGNK